MSERKAGDEPVEPGTIPGLVSTIIPVYNRGEMILQAVSSVLTQSYGYCEVILVDDGSTDDTGDVLDSLSRRYPDTVRVCKRSNGGPGAARESGRRQARGEFIQYLDSDDYLLPDKFQRQVDALRHTPHSDIAYGVTRLVDSHGVTLCEPFKGTGLHRETLFPQLLVERWWNTHTPLYRRSLLDKVGPWPDNRLGEDWQYDARCGAHNARLVFVNSPVAATVLHENDRLTGGPVTEALLKELGDLLPVLHESALSAGESLGTPEMQHFSRWAFSLSRTFGRIGDAARAARMFELSQRSDRNDGRSLEHRCYMWLTRVIGWRLTSTVAEVLSTACRRTGGAGTLETSESDTHVKEAFTIRSQAEGAV